MFPVCVCCFIWGCARVPCNANKSDLKAVCIKLRRSAFVAAWQLNETRSHRINPFFQLFTSFCDFEEVPVELVSVVPLLYISEIQYPIEGRRRRRNHFYGTTCPPPLPLELVGARRRRRRRRRQRRRRRRRRRRRTVRVAQRGSFTDVGKNTARASPQRCGCKALAG